jgi:hypothetical protein
MAGNLANLKRQARISAHHRGHELGEWIDADISAVAYCEHCQQWAYVDAQPAPNGIDISGPAVAVNCEGTRNA